MSWLRLDDKFAQHPKVHELSDRAFRVHVEVMLYCAEYDTGGVVPSAALKLTRASPVVCAKLVSVGLWRTKLDGEGFIVHDFEQYNSRQAEVREQARLRQQRHRTRHGDVTAVTSDKRDGSVTSARASPSPSPKSVSSTPTSKVHVGNLEPGNELTTARLLSALGTLEETKTDYIRGAASRLPESVVAGVLELVTAGHPRDPVGYVLGAMRRELEQRGLAA